MSALRLWFVVQLRSDLPFRQGPLFHKWLPEDKKDAIALSTDDPQARITVWFERRGSVQGGFLVYNQDKREIDSTIIPRQAILDGGLLFGQIEIEGLSQDESDSLRDNKLGDPNYVSLGKRVVGLLQPPVARFIDVLRINYGQYWLSRLKEWDSRTRSLGAYCSGLQLRWSLDDGGTWEKFQPDPNVQSLSVSLTESFDDYLTKDDWQQIARLSSDEYEPSLAEVLLGEAHELRDTGNLRHALVQGVTALEAALEQVLRERAAGLRAVDPDLADRLWGSWTNNISLPIRLTATATILGNPPPQDIQRAIEAIKLRDKVVHEGWRPAADDRDVELNLSKLLTVSAALLSRPTFRFPTANPGNQLEPR